MTQQMVLALSTAYASEIRPIRVANGIGITGKPVWTVAVPREEDTFYPISRRMFLWLNENVEHDKCQIHNISAMSWGIEAVTFDHHDDALLFYMAFK